LAKKLAAENYNNPVSLSMESTLANIKALSDALGMMFNLNTRNSCSLRVDNEFTMHMTYIPTRQRLYIFSSILENIHKYKAAKFRIYNELLLKSLNRADLFGGGVGLVSEKNIIVYHIELDMTNAPDFTVKILCSDYIKKLLNICERNYKI